MPPLNNIQKTFLAAAVAQSLTTPVQAATITVNSVADTSQANPNTCTLRDAIIAANFDSTLIGSSCDAGSGADTIELEGGTIILSDELPTIESNVTINGPGQEALFIDGASLHRHFTLFESSAALHLNDLTLKNGFDSQGGAIYARNGSVSISNSTLSSNIASNEGGAIYAYGGSVSISISNSTLSSNIASNDGGAIYAFSGSVSISNSTLSNNSADSGGAIYAYRGSSVSISISNSTLSSNIASNEGGAIYAFSGSVSISNSTLSNNSANSGGAIYAYGGSVSISNSTLSGNSVSFEGGAINAQSISNTSISNSTLSGNRASRSGGAIFAAGFGYDGPSIIISNSTLSGNSAAFGGGVYARNNSSISVSNSILSGNMGNTSFVEIAISSNSSISTNNSIFSSSNTTSAEAFVNFDPIASSATNLNLSSDAGNVPLAQIREPLANNGGITQTHKLPSGSPAIDAGSNTSCPATDQRGVSRNDGRCDIGAYEVDSSSFFVIPLPNGKGVVVPL